MTFSSGKPLRILVVTATAPEVQPLISRLRHLSDTGMRCASYRIRQHDVDVLTTGVGMVATAAWCSRACAAEHYDLALNFGVCGSFDPGLPPGSVVHVTSDCFSELGAEDGDELLTLQQLELLEDDEFPFDGGRLLNASPPALPPLMELQQVSGITVNTVHGNERTIGDVRARYQPDVESMEGAAFMYSCVLAGVPFAQVRAVSNLVERRNRASWKLDEAIRALGVAAVRLLESV